MRYLAIPILSMLFLTTCSHSWIAKPKDVPGYKRCQPFKGGPQMVKIPHFERSFLLTDGCWFMDTERVSIAMYLFFKEWKKRFSPDSRAEQDVLNALNALMVEVGDSKKTVTAYTMDGTIWSGASASGLTVSPTWVWIRVRDGQRLCDTSFVHELIHVVIWATKKTDGDPDHLGSKYYGWKIDHNVLMQEVNELLCRWGV